jgi:hypothetical protein
MSGRKLARDGKPGLTSGERRGVKTTIYPPSTLHCCEGRRISRRFLRVRRSPTVAALELRKRRTTESRCPRAIRHCQNPTRRDCQAHTGANTSIYNRRLAKQEPRSGHGLSGSTTPGKRDVGGTGPISKGWLTSTKPYT